MVADPMSVFSDLVTSSAKYGLHVRLECLVRPSFLFAAIYML